jgi:hypothetical protein
VRGLSLPSKDPAEDDDAPDWLAQLRSGFGEESDDLARMTEDRPLEPASTPEESDPFSGFGGPLPTETNDDQGTPLGSSEEPDDDIPDWLRDALSGAEPSPVGPETPSSTPVPDREIEPTDLEAGELPDWLMEPSPAEGPTGLDRLGDDELSDLQADLPTQVPPASEIGSDELPDWLQDMTEMDQAGAQPAEDGVQEPDELPDWLQEAAAAETVLQEEEVEPEPGESMDWLQDIGTTETPVDKGVSDLDRGETEPDGLPDWLREAAAAKTVQEEKSESDLVPGDMPDWLQQLRPQEDVPEDRTPDTEPSPDEVEPGQVPEWLQEIGETGILPEVPPEEDTPPVGEPVLQTGDLPDWLQAIGPPEEPEVPQPDLDKIIPDEPGDLLEMPKPETIDTGELGPLPGLKEEPAEVGASSELPDWLDAMGPLAAKGPPTEDTEDDGLPKWLQDFALEDESDTPGLAPPAPLIPKKKAPVPRPAPKSPPRPAAPTPAEASALTDWLGETAPQAPDGALDPTRAFEGTGPLVAPELPEWLAAVGDSSSSELPDWLDREDEVETLLKPDTGPLKERPAAAALPSWLTAEDAGLAPSTEEAVPGEEELEPGELPDWLQLAPVATGQPGLDADDIPEYIVPAGGLDAADTAFDLDSTPFTDQDAAIDVGLASQLGLVQAEIPDWLQALKPAETPVAAPIPVAVESLEPVETSGFLEGVRGALTSRAEVSILTASQVPSGFTPTAEHQAHAQVLEQIILAGPAPIPDIARERRVQAWLEHLVIPFLILVAVFFPLAAGLFPELGGDPLQSFLGERVSTQQVNDTFDLLEDPASESRLVIAAFDYSPARAGELDPIAAAMLRHLVAQGARVLTVSTTPTGSEIAQSVMEKVTADQDYQYGEDYANLGYIPGGATGLRAFATDPWGLFSGTDYLGRVDPASSASAAAGLGRSLENADLLLILTGERDDLLGWIEQVGRLDETQSIKMVAGVSASLEPWAQPYYQSASGQLDGLVSGIPDAAQYERLVNQNSDAEQSDDATTLQDSQALALGVIILVIAGGLVLGVGQGLVNRRRADG